MPKKSPYYQVGDTVHYHFGDKISSVLIDDGYHAVMLSAEGPECANTGCVADLSYHWETTESMILEGYVAISLDANEQDKWDEQRRQYLDCWGE